MRKVDKTEILANEYASWIAEYEKISRKHVGYSASHKYYKDVLVSLLWCQGGVCAYTEIFIGNGTIFLRFQIKSMFRRETSLWIIFSNLTHRNTILTDFWGMTGIVTSFMPTRTWKMNASLNELRR